MDYRLAMVQVVQLLILWHPTIPLQNMTPIKLIFALSALKIMKTAWNSWERARGKDTQNHYVHEPKPLCLPLFYLLAESYPPLLQEWGKVGSNGKGTCVAMAMFTSVERETRYVLRWFRNDLITVFFVSPFFRFYNPHSLALLAYCEPSLLYTSA